MTIVTIVIPSGGTFTVPSDWTNNNTIFAIGGGQAGFDGTLNASAGGAGGHGADFVPLINTAALSPNQVLNIQIGAGGASNGATGGDTWLENNSGTKILLAKGGGSASSNIGTLASANAGGAGGLSASGRGGGGGGGAGGPNGVGAAGGTTSPIQINLSFSSSQDGGTGGGAANGGQAGGAGGTHYNFGTFNYGLTLQAVGGDGGDGGNGANTTYLVSGSPFPNIGGLFMSNQAGLWGSGGAGGPCFTNTLGRNYCADTGITVPPYPIAASAGKRFQNEWGGGNLATIGGSGFLWGDVSGAPPADWTMEAPVYVPGHSAGAGGGGGGGGGGTAPSIGYVNMIGRVGGNYGGGGGGGGSWVTGSLVTNGQGAAGGGGVLVVQYTPAAPAAAEYTQVFIVGL